MALATERRTVGALDVEVTQLGYFRAQRLFMRVLKVAGPALTSLVTLLGKGDGASLLEADAGKLAELLGDFFARLDPQEIEALTREILATAVVYLQGKRLDLLPVIESPEVCGGDVLLGLRVQAFALSVHFGNFSTALGGLDALRKRASDLPASTTSTDGKDARS